MILNIIAAVSLGNLGIGNKGDLCYKIPDDLKRFKELTMGCPIIMGSNTFRSLPGQKGLPGRTNIVISSRDNFPSGVVVYNDLGTVIRLLDAQMNPEENVFIIGGGKIYQEGLDFADKLLLTEIHGNPEADTFFPEWRNNTDWKLINKEERKFNDIQYDFTEYERVSPMWSRDD